MKEDNEEFSTCLSWGPVKEKELTANGLNEGCGNAVESKGQVKGTNKTQ